MTTSALPKSVDAVHHEEGSARLTLVIVTPVVLLCLMAVVQFALWYHASHVAIAAAQEGARSARLLDSSAGAGEERANQLRNELAAAVRQQSPPPPFNLRDERLYTSWGAEHALQLVVLQLAHWAVEGVVGGLAYAALQALIERIRAEGLEKLPAGWMPRPLTVEEADQRSRWLLIERQKMIDASALQLTEHEFEEPTTWRLVYEYDGNVQVLGKPEEERSRYAVELVESGGLVSVMKVRRTLL